MQGDGVHLAWAGGGRHGGRQWPSCFWGMESWWGRRRSRAPASSARPCLPSPPLSLCHRSPSLPPVHAGSEQGARHALVLRHLHPALPSCSDAAGAALCTHLAGGGRGPPPARRPAGGALGGQGARRQQQQAQQAQQAQAAQAAVAGGAPSYADVRAAALERCGADAAAGGATEPPVGTPAPADAGDHSHAPRQAHKRRKLAGVVYAAAAAASIGPGARHGEGGGGEADGCAAGPGQLRRAVRGCLAFLRSAPADGGGGSGSAERAAAAARAAAGGEGDVVQAAAALLPWQRRVLASAVAAEAEAALSAAGLPAPVRAAASGVAPCARVRKRACACSCASLGLGRARSLRGGRGTGRPGCPVRGEQRANLSGDRPV
jgi:hypothetical protein